MPEAYTVLAFDFGLKRIGVAVGQSVTRSATPLGILAARSREDRLKMIAPLVKSWEPSILVIGQPFYPDGQPSEMTRLSAKFARQISDHFGLPFRLIDERYTSVTVGGQDLIDAHAAVLIAQQFFSELYER